MNTSRADARVRKHFDGNVDLYVDLYAETYKTICRKRIELLRPFLKSRAGESFRILDVGCGGGMFLDMLLEEYPKAQAIGIDSSLGMLGKNLAQPRKALVLGDAKELPLRHGTIDLVNVDTVMHHLVNFCGYQNTLTTIKEFLLSVREVLRPGGLLIVHEIYHEYIFRDNFGSWLAFQLSTLRLPNVAANSLKRLGMMTANAGVCFLTRRQWPQMFTETRYEVLQITDKPWKNHYFQKMGFRANGEVYYTLRAKASGALLRHE